MRGRCDWLAATVPCAEADISDDDLALETSTVTSILGSVRKCRLV